MRRIWLILSQVVTLALVMGYIVYSLKPNWLAAWQSAASAPTPAPAVVAAPEPRNTPNLPAPDLTVVPSFRQAVKTAAPAVVSIRAARQAPSAANEDLILQFLLGQGIPPRGKSQAIGSGVIVREGGFVLTNNHVIDNMDHIEVQLQDSRIAQARVIGRDPDSDLALLHIALDQLPVITWADSDALEVGDPVLAIGNPFGVGQTVTSGIVSGLRRHSLGLSTFENFIQTDAAINPGNSGGALVDTAGRLLGINTAIYSQSGGNMGIGFAIPSSLAQLVLDGLLQDGSVKRGWIGIEPQDLSPDLAVVFQLGSHRQGAVIRSVLADGPAAAAGLKPGDLIVAVAGQAIKNTNELISTIAGLTPEHSVPFDIIRKEQALRLNLTPSTRPSPPPANQRR